MNPPVMQDQEVGLSELAGPFGTLLRVDAAGHVRDLMVGDLRVNLFRPGPHDQPIDGIWLRRRHGDTADAVHLTATATHLSGSASGVVWSGTALGVAWRARLSPTTSQAGWQWDVELEPLGGSAGQLFDLVLVQDVALAPPGAVRTNELYVSHYVTHELLRGPASDGDLVVASRQTMAEAPRLPLLLTHWVGGSRAASTDAFDLAGPTSRRTGMPAWLGLWDWPTRVRQYEHSQVALASAGFRLTAPRRLTAVLTVVADHRGPLAEGLRLLGVPDDPSPIPHPDAERPSSLLGDAPLRHGADDPLLPPGARFVERDGAGPLSWFDASGAHAVAGRKEDLVERSHGEILLDADRLDPAVPALCTTVFAPGVFCSHLALGNTNLHRVMTIHRDSLNHLRSSGTRLLVDAGDGAHLLAIPSRFVLSPGSAAWSYTWDGHRVDVTTVVASGEPLVRIRLRSSEPVRVIATIALDDETGPWEVAASDGRLVVTPRPDHPASRVEPGLAYVLDSAWGWEDDACLWSDGRARCSEMVVTRSPGRVREAELTLAASTSGAADAVARTLTPPRFAPWEATQTQRHADFLRRVLGGLSVSGPDARWPEIDVMLPWLAHDAVVHLLSPHGLEQFSGAAWGTRDVCQGPFELALACGHDALARDLLLRVFGHQFPDGDFPQWFMFDGYETHQPDSHGDVPVWPLLALAEYLATTGDAAILDEPVGWLARGAGPADARPAGLRDHVSRILDHVEANLVPSTGLYAFGEGDWDDTLQPVDPAARRGMVSSWTEGLLIEACERLGVLLAGPASDVAERAARIGRTGREAFGALLVRDAMVAGLAHFGDGPPQLLIHPGDTTTGQHVRLISLTQAVLADLLPDAERRAAVDSVAGRLRFADGVRLMDRPLPWHEGIPRIFRRGEQSAFFGREVGLMYTHALLRWVQALAHLGDPSALDLLLLAVPVQLSDRLGALALPRQRNCYYSSSDARFLTRAEASARWDDLREGRVPVAGGWRVYSSGPGIMVRLLAREIL
ncbi:MAG TPA: hypothetical protein VHO26_07320, partial [Propionibacteriaceae bacterium]|nr:hypothetical protein [Propionibacteriaceae bacterium]